MMTYLERIRAIETACKKHNIPCQINRQRGGWQIRFPWTDGDVACNALTYGNTAGYVESYRFPWDNDDVTVLTVDEAIYKVIAYYLLLEIEKLPNPIDI